ncbi:hypothetical protein [Geodermatophilus sp. CPCC 206100]|uniref:hypothetical protein n=1 Tax=Geodermatophilus sp. CPCC 206100 TaxID=3020054 RepID=UPI003AFF96AE
MTGPRLAWQDGTLEVRAERRGLRTEAGLLRNGAPVASGTGVGKVLLPLPGTAEPAPTVLVLTPLPGVVTRAVLLVPRPPGEDDETPGDEPPDGGAPDRDDLPAGARRALDLATAERHPFDPAPGTLAARLRHLEERHPRLWATRHVVLAVGRVLLGLLGLAVLLRTVLRPLLDWLAGLLPRIDWPDIPWPDLPSIPWPDVDWPDLPDVSPPGWLAAVLATAKFWGPVLVAVVLAVREVRRKRRGARGPGSREASPGEDEVDAHR